MSRIITFYSYKGGVGRTFALANISISLAKRGKKVLLMDWDLEAPGLHRYFLPYLSQPMRPQGLIQILSAATHGEDVNWRSAVNEVRINSEIAISLIPSGDQSSHYANLVNQFSWDDFFGKQSGADILEKWRSEWKEEYDFIFIDSRTGLTDTGGVCTVFLPDLMVLVFSSNNQSFERGIQAALGAQLGRRNLAVPRAPLAILPVPGKFDGRDEIDEARIWLDRFSKELKVFYDDWLPKQFDPRQILELTKVPYVTKFSFGEPLPVLSHGVTDPELPGFYLDIIARLLVSDFQEARKILSPDGEPSIGIAELRTQLEKVPIDEVQLDQALSVIENETTDPAELVELLNDAGTALLRQNRFEFAEIYLRRAILISEQQPGYPPAAIASFANLADLLHATGRLAEEETFRQRLLEVLEQTVQRGDPAVLIAYSNLASLYRDMGRLLEAEEFYRRALFLAEESGRHGAFIAIGLHGSLGRLLQQTNRFQTAEEAFKRALQIANDIDRSNDPIVLSVFDNLARLYHNIGRLSQAEEVYLQALKSSESTDQANNPNILNIYSGLARLYREMGRLSEAESIYKRAIIQSDKSQHPLHPTVLTIYRGLARIYRDTGRIYDAENIYHQALDVANSVLRHDAPAILSLFSSLARLYRQTGRSDEAERTYLHAIKLAEKSGRAGTSAASLYNDLGRLYRETNRLDEAEEIYLKILELTRKSDLKAPNEVKILNKLAEIYMLSEKWHEAELLLREALNSLDETSNVGHSEIAKVKMNMARVFEATGRQGEAVALSRRAKFDAMILRGNNDQRVIRQIASELAARGVKVWFDEWEIAPGQSWLRALETITSSVPAIIVCISPGMGPWQSVETDSLIRRSLSENVRVIPVLLPGQSEANEYPKLPLNLAHLKLLDLRGGINKDAMDRLAWGVTGKKLR